MVSPRWSLPRTPAAWILLPVALLAGLVGLLLSVLPALWAPRSTAVVLGLTLLATAGRLWFVLRLADPVERRPWWLVGVALCWGGGAAGLVSMGGNYYGDRAIGRGISPQFAATWGAALTAPTVEELAKAAGVVLVLLIARPYVGTAWAGAVYGALVGAGFSALEDMQYGLVAADEALPDDVVAAVGVTLLRIGILGPVGHSLFTAVTGAGIAYAWLRRDLPGRRRAATLAGAFGLSWLMHFAVNSPFGSAAGALLEPLPGAADVAGYLVVVTALAVPAMWVLLRLRRHDATVVLRRAAALAPGLLAPADVDTLVGLRRRARAGRAVHRTHGAAAARAARRLRRAQLRFAAAVSRPYRGFPPVGPPGWVVPPVLRRWAEVEAARAELPAGMPPRAVPVGVAAGALPLPVAPPVVPVGVVPGALPLPVPPPGGAAVAGPAGLPAPGPQPPAAAADPRSVGAGGTVAGPADRSGGRRWSVPAVLTAAAVVGVLWWPVAIAVVGAAGWLAWRARDRGAGTPTASALLAAAGCGWVWLVGVVDQVFFPV